MMRLKACSRCHGDLLLYQPVQPDSPTWVCMQCGNEMPFVPQPVAQYQGRHVAHEPSGRSANRQTLG